MTAGMSDGDRPLRAAVIGTNWGRVHIQGLRRAGAEVVALCSDDLEECRRVAAAEGVAEAYGDSLALRALELDLVVIATPASTHAALLAQFAHLPVICEKPLFGYRSGVTLTDVRPEGAGPLWVNYAFAFLDSARVFTEELHRRAHGPVSGSGLADVVESIELSCEVNLQLDLARDLSGPEWFLEVASHPLSLLVHLFGPPKAVDGGCRDKDTWLQVRFAGGIPGHLRCDYRGPAGIRQCLRVHLPTGTLCLRGGFAVGTPWRYDAVTWNHAPLNQGEFCPEDCWIRANYRSIRQILCVLQGQLSAAEAVSNGLFDGEKAHNIDRCIDLGLLVNLR